MSKGNGILISRHSRPEPADIDRESSVVDFDALVASHHVDDPWPATLDTIDDLVERARPVVADLPSSWARVSYLRKQLEQLAMAPGASWQERWLAAGHEQDLRLWRQVDSQPERATNAAYGMLSLLIVDAVRPSYLWLVNHQFKAWRLVLERRDPEGFRQVERALGRLGQSRLQNSRAIIVLARIACRTGKGPTEIVGDDLLAYWTALSALGDEAPSAGKRWGVGHAWDCLREMGTLRHKADTLRLALRAGQLTPEEIVDFYGVQSANVRECLVRYLRAREGTMDYGSWANLAYNLVGLFWRDIEKHIPGHSTLELTTEQAANWVKRLAVKEDGSERKSRFSTLFRVRAMYMDIATWAMTDPTWATWVAPSPVSQKDVAGYSKKTKADKAQSHKRTRERAPEKDRLLAATEARLKQCEAWLAEYAALDVGSVVEHEGKRYERIGKTAVRLRPHGQSTMRGTLNITHLEDDAFWAWATVHLLHETGLRIEGTRRAVGAVRHAASKGELGRDAVLVVGRESVGIYSSLAGATHNDDLRLYDDGVLLALTVGQWWADLRWRIEPQVD